ncbi:SH3 domain-containing protein [Pararhizobium sp. YC-54]|nr:SH3 domain-containing protein [Pararhizobium sp. YC-54]MCV9997762.1 SH3 domain-containing protein [Pararhizobium sp. YC-54]
MAIAVAAAAFLLPVAAQAAEGFATANVNMRSGPSTRYPAVTVIPAGTAVEIHGCLADVPWCDVSFYDGRGWVAGRYVQALYQQRRVYVEPDYYDSLGIPLVTFEFGTYWDRHYRHRDFYRERDYYRRDRDRDRYTPDRRPRRDYNTYQRPRYNDEDGIIIERPRRDRDRDRERIERRRDDNSRQFDNDQSNRRERDRERIERRNRNSEQQIERRNNRQERSNRQERNRDGDNRYRKGGQQGGDGCRPRDPNCN